MFDLGRIPILRVLLPFAGGALAAYKFLYPCQFAFLWLSSVLMGIFLLVGFHWRGRNGRGSPVVFILFSFLVFFMSGFTTGYLSRPVDPRLPLHEKVMVRGVISEGPRRGTNSWACGLESVSLCSRDSLFLTETLLKVYLPLPADSLPAADSIWPLVGELWQFYGQLVPVTNSGNPGGVDFKSILNRKNCWYRFYSDPVCLPRRVEGSIHGKGGRNPQIIADLIQKRVTDNWSGNGKEKEISLLKAVCLGDRSDLTRELKLAYTNAGAMHLLAVSGLHMGLIWWVLYGLFAWMVRISGKEFFRSLTIIGILWIFAFVTGFSSSVSRSATMFTLFTAGRLLGQRMHAMNGILVSAFFLILVDPSRIFDVGFQLSYAAILGIVALYPSFRRLLRTKNRVTKWIWEGAIVSLSAQISTAPLVIYYFHQLPLYSMVTSLITIPILSLLIATFVISVPFMAAGIGSELFSWILLKLAFLINFSVETLASIPGGVLDELNLQQTNLWLWMGMIGLGMLVLNQTATLARYLFIVLLSANLCWSARCGYLRSSTSEMVIGHFSRASILTFRQGTHVDHYGLWRDSSALSYLENYTSQNWSRHQYKTSLTKLGERGPVKGATSACVSLKPGIWFLGNNQIKGWIVTGESYPNAYQLPAFNLEGDEGIKVDFLLLSGNPSLKLISPGILYGSRELILDGSNRKWYLSEIERYKQKSDTGFSIYNTGELGAYLKRW